MQFRTERDPLGEFEVPADAYYGIQTARAVENFHISDLRAPVDLVVATVLIKRAAAEANEALDRLDARVARAIVQACDEIRRGALRDQFVVDVYQAGAGTSHNMNTNEVVANRAAEILGGARGDYSLVHPNDHVNMGQSTNDVFPTATRLALLIRMRPLVDAGRGLASALREKADAFAHVLKVGRTHLQDAVPMTLGQEFGGYAACIERGVDDVEHAAEQLRELNLGATAVGTGLNAGDDYTRLVVSNLSRTLAVDLVPAANRFRVTQSMGDVVAYSGAIRRLAVELSKVSSDLRLLSSGPRAGLAEIVLPAVQPGSSIMPGKVNPTQSEAMTMVAVQVFANDLATSFGGSQGNFELNVFKPVMIHNFLHSVRLLHDATHSFVKYCISGIELNRAQIDEHLRDSLMLVTALNPYIGYDNAAKVAKNAHKKGISLKASAIELGLLTAEEFDKYVKPEEMTHP